MSRKEMVSAVLGRNITGAETAADLESATLESRQMLLETLLASADPNLHFELARRISTANSTNFKGDARASCYASGMA